MNKYSIYIIFLVSFLLSCGKEEITFPRADADRTVFMYLPWASDLYGEFLVNIADLESAVSRGVLGNERVVVFLSSSATEATLFEITYANGQAVRETVKIYNSPAFTTASGITSILNDVKTHAPAAKYSMIIGCHGMGWIPVGAASATRQETSVEVGQYGTGHKTRWFGGTSALYQTDVMTLAQAISDAGIKMEYILFDDCYMSSVEAAYDLRNVTDYLIGCPTEVMAYGMPYSAMAEYLFGEPDFEAATDAFLEFYSGYSVPCGTIAVTVCSELDALAGIMKQINGAFTFDGSLSSVQRMDGYYPQRFVDLGDYVSQLCEDDVLLTRFRAQLEKAVPPGFRKHTAQFYTRASGAISINAFSGITTSDPYQSTYTAAKTETAWWAATHN